MPSKRVAGTNFRGRDTGKAAAASELLVSVDLLRRGFEVTRPLSHTAKHDLHVDIPSVGWKGVQVKSAEVRLYTDTWRIASSSSRRRPPESPIVALVFLRDKRIRYIAGTEPLPPELLE